MRQKKVLFLCGPHAAGKTHAAQLLKRKGAILVDLGPTIRSIHKESGSDKNLGDWVIEQESKYGKNFTDEVLYQHIANQLSEDDDNRDMVIIGSRSKNNIDYISRRLTNADSSVIYLEATRSHLKQRYEKREGQQLSDEQFDALLKRDTDMGVEQIKSIADVIIVNNGTAEEFEKRFLNAAQSLGIDMLGRDITYDPER